MERIEQGQWVVEFDREATREVFRQILQGDPDVCGCAYCRNFIASRCDIYPRAFLEFLESVGVDCAKESEVYQFTRMEDGRHLYGGCFHFVGQLVQQAGNDGSFMTAGDFACTLLANRALASKLFGSQPLVEVLFETRVPWVLPEKEPEE